MRTKYPRPSQADRIQVYLYFQKAFDRKSATFLKNTSVVRKLVKQERIVKAGNKFYLTDIGKMVALGALDMFPELAVWQYEG